MVSRTRDAQQQDSLGLTRLLLATTALAGGMYMSTPPALAADTTWQNTTSSDWNDNGGWSNGFPTVADNVFISGSVPGFLVFDPVISGFAGFAADVTLGLLPGAVATGSLEINNGGSLSSENGYIGHSAGTDYAVTVTGGSTWINSNILQIGLAGSGTLTINGGSTVSSATGIVATSPDSTGVVTVTDGSTWSNSGGLTVGNGGVGTLGVSNNSLLESDAARIGSLSGSSGSVNIVGTGSVWNNTGSIYIGEGGLGYLLIADGADVTSKNGDLGTYSSGNGLVNVDGTGSTWSNTSALSIGGSGAGALQVTNGGVVSNTEATLGWVGDSTGQAIVSGGSTWTNTGALTVGRAGEGLLEISDGGSVTNTQGFIGTQSTGLGQVSVDGTSSTWQIGGGSGYLVVGQDGEGHLTISNGGLVTNGQVDIAYDADSSGSVSVEGGTWINSDSLGVGVGGIGSLSITSGLVESVGGFVGDEANSQGSVTVDGGSSAWNSTNFLYVGYSGEGHLTVANGGTVNVDAGTGTLTVAYDAGSTGTVAVGAAAGDPAADAGVLATGTLSFGDGTGTLIFNHSDVNYSFDPVISGSGTINHFAGETILSADSSGFAGSTMVSGGTLVVNGSLGGMIDVDGGILGGTGTVSNLAVNAGGTLAPGNSVGTMNVASTTFNPGSIYEVELNDGGFGAGTNNDLLDATGTVTINGGTVYVTPENGTDDGSTYAAPGTYTIVTAGSVTGAGFDTVTDDYVFLDFALDYDPSNVYLNSEQAVFFSDIAQTPNQQAIADPLEALGSGNAVYDALLGLVGNEDDARAAFDSLTGEIHASAQTTLLEDSRFPREAAQGRLRVVLGGVGANNSAQIEDRISESFGLWGQGFGSWSQWGSDGNAAALDRTIGGFLMGGDALVWDNARFGVLGGFSRSSFSIDDRASSGTADTYTLGVYGGGEWDAFTLTGGVAHSWHSLDTSRSVAFSGFSDSLSASYSARTLQAWGEAAYSLKAGAARFEPFANLAYVNLSTDGFTETGGAAALTAASNTVDATFTTLGLRAETDVALGDMNATLRGMVGWRHAFGDTPTSQMRFASGGDAFTIAGVPLAQDSLVLDARFDVNLTDNATLGFAYGGQFGSGVQDHSASLSLNVRF
jgi:outer membrane autotransporter protein